LRREYLRRDAWGASRCSRNWQTEASTASMNSKGMYESERSFLKR
jgi:hypothetical protein